MPITPLQIIFNSKSTFIMKSLNILLATLLSLITLFAQKESIPIGAVTYIQKIDLQAEAHKNGPATLLFNNSRSIYINNSAPKRDSSFSTEEYVAYNITGDKEGFPIYKVHAERQLFCKIPCRQSRNHCIVRDTFGAIPWVLHPEHKRFGQYDCRRATGIFRGREYEAWYTLEIPIPSGPYKLGGLPGLILEARSLDNVVEFAFGGLLISNMITGDIKFPEGKDMGVTQAAYQKDLEAFKESVLKDQKAQGYEVTITIMETIELNMNN